MEAGREKNLAKAGVLSLVAYADFLAHGDLEENRGKIKQIRAMVEQIAFYHGIEGIETDCVNRVQEKYLKPLDRLLEGKRGNSSPKFSEIHMQAIYAALGYYKEELIAEEESVYEPDIQSCKELMEEIHMCLRTGGVYERKETCMGLFPD